MTWANAFFKLDDPHVSEIMGGEIHPTWWSRHYEYPWAFQFAEPGQIVADMGCGWHQRPFKDALAQVCKKVYAVDSHPDVVLLPGHPNMQFVVASITEPIEAIEAGSLDRVFCISVIEDLREIVGKALAEFTRCVKPDGLVIITCDSQYDYDKPLGKYPGVPIDVLEQAVDEAGLEFVGDVDWNKDNALYHEGFNLAVVHMVLRRKQ
jgi:ubiquinone/menaquinone biosynthesis C-methylase UbiE